MFREDDQIKKRLSAYFEREIIGDSSVSNVSNLLVGTEFIISKYKVNDSIELFATSRKLVLSNGSAFFTMDYNMIKGLYCDVPFKGDGNPHVLNIVTTDKRLVKVSFDDVTSLLSARNEIYKVINAVIIEWQKIKFRGVETIQNIQFDIINIPPLPDNASKLLN
jgi:hypothetical protein